MNPNIQFSFVKQMLQEFIRIGSVIILDKFRAKYAIPLMFITSLILLIVKLGENLFSTICLSIAVIGFGTLSLLDIKRK